MELTEIIGPRADPRAHGSSPADGFHVVAPSVPAFGFSTPTSETGWNLHRITVAFAELIGRLGYERYGAHGGDFGAMLSPELGRVHRDRVVGVHVNGVPHTAAPEPGAAGRHPHRHGQGTARRLQAVLAPAGATRWSGRPGPRALRTG